MKEKFPKRNKKLRPTLKYEVERFLLVLSKVNFFKLTGGRLDVVAVLNYALSGVVSDKGCSKNFFRPLFFAKR